MKSKQIFATLIFVGMTLGACSGSKKGGAANDTLAGQDTSAVKPADSTHSFRNDRGTDSVSSGKSVPAKP